jgi:hypothetical protein
MASLNIPPETDICVVSGGQIRMFTAFQLAQLEQSCVVIEKNTQITIQPKIEDSSHRPMEIYHRMGMMEHSRPQGVAENYKFAELFTTGLDFPEPILDQSHCRPI